MTKLKKSKMNQHTPGPWRYENENGSPTTGQHMIAGAKPGYLAEVRDCGNGDVAANGRLIAAAPELLGVLQEMDQLGEWAGTEWAIPASTWRKARAVIAKVTR